MTTANGILDQAALADIGAFARTTQARANGEVFTGPSGEVYYAQSDAIVEASSGGTGTDYTPSTTYFGVKFVASADASYIQGAQIRLKKTGALTATSRLIFTLYADVAGVPSGAGISTGSIYGGMLTSFDVYQTMQTVVQNVSTPLTPGATYWIVFTRSESGGAFVLDSDVGTGTTAQGASLAAFSESNVRLSVSVYARTQYGFHTYAPYGHGIWGVSLTGVGVRGDSTYHYGGYFQSVADIGVRGLSTYAEGVYGSSTYGAGAMGETASAAAHGVYGANTSATGGYAGVFGTSLSGPGVIANTSVTGGGATAFRAFQGLMFGSGRAGQGDVAASATKGVPAGFTTYAGDLFVETDSNAGGALLYSVTTAGTPGIFSLVNRQSVSADQGDAGLTATYATTENTLVWNTPITADRTVTLNTTGLATSDGAMKRIVRTAAATGAYNLIIAGLLGAATKNLAVGTWADVEYARTLGGWIVTASGSL